MQKLNRLGWADGFSFRAYGLTLGVRVNTPEALPRLYDLLPFGWEPAEELEVDHLFSLFLGGSPGDQRRVRRFTLAFSDSAQIARSLDPNAVLDKLQSSLHLLVGEFARTRVFVHAGVVEWNGGAIILPGRTFTGKSRLTAALVRAGASYLSDEFAVLDHNGLVHPFAKPLSIRREHDHIGEPMTAEALGGIVASCAIPATLVVSCRYIHAAKWSHRKLSPGKAILELLNNTLAARRNPEFVLPILDLVASRCPTYRARRGEAEEAVARILRLCERAQQRTRS